jgi:hypothetical protein
MKFHLITLLSALGIMSSCGQKAETGGLPTLDLEAAIDNPRPFDLSEIAQTIEFIPLDDSSKESLVGAWPNISESKTGFYVHDDWESPVKYFDKTGKFISTRGHVGRGPNELTSIAGITVNYETDDLYAWDVLYNSVVGYNATGGMIARNDSVNLWWMTWHDGKLVSHKRRDYKLDGKTPEPDAKIVMFEIFSPDLVLEKSIERPDRGEVAKYSDNGNIMMTPDVIWAYNGRDIFLKESLCDTLFRYQTDMTLEPAAIFDFGKYTTPAGAFGPSPSVSWRDDFLGLGRIMFGDRYTIAYVSNGATPGVAQTLIFDKNDAQGGFSATGADGATGLFIGSIEFMLQYIRDNRLVGYMSALEIVDNADSITNPDLQTLATTLREDSNPVIVVVQLKE